MLLAYLHLGARRSEIFRLCWEDVDFGNSRIRLFTRKRRDGSLEYDWLPMTGELEAALRSWWDNRTFQESTHVFICEQDGGFCAERHGKPFKERMHFMKTLCARAGVKAFGFHAIRHLTASILYKMGQPVSIIQAILRHKSPNTTAGYLKSLGLEETRGALDALADRFEPFPERMPRWFTSNEKTAPRRRRPVYNPVYNTTVGQKPMSGRGANPHRIQKSEARGRQRKPFPEPFPDKIRVTP